MDGVRTLVSGGVSLGETDTTQMLNVLESPYCSKFWNSSNKKIKFNLIHKNILNVSCDVKFLLLLSEWEVVFELDLRCAMKYRACWK